MKKLILLYVLFGFVVIPLSAFVDTVQFQQGTALDYLIVCGWEYICFGSGIVLSYYYFRNKQLIKIKVKNDN